MAVKKRIGLALATIHTGVSQNVWSSFARTAAAQNISLFIFPGGRLNARQNFENLRNSIYNLINDENLDGCISWSSTIHYNQPKEEFEHFHAGFEPLPCVTVGHKLPGYPCVEFDAYNGTKILLTHCIQNHGAEKIVFLRGPGFHQSACARYEGYLDALKEAGLTMNTSLLVTDPFNWNEGEAAAAQLFKNRSLVPGRDFDTLAGSSDLMVLGAMNYFARHGYHVPSDYYAVGFNNSEESRVAETPLSTVHLPNTELSKESIKILFGIMDKKKLHAVKDLRLKTEVVIRESCGCVDHGLWEQAHLHGNKNAGSDAETLAKMAKDYLKIDSFSMNSLVMPAIKALLEGRPECFFPLFEKVLNWFFNTDKEPENLLRLICDLKTLNIPEIDRLEPAMYRSVFRIREQFNARARFEKEGWNTVLNSLKCDLLRIRDRFTLIQSLALHLPKIGINTAAIVLYIDEKTSVFAGGFSVEGISPVREQRFPARLLVPAELKPQYSDGIFMVQPLFIENRSLGYFLHNVSISDGVLIEELRSSISHALKGVSLLEEADRARKVAEKLERAKTEFLQTLEDGLYNPLQGIMERLETLEEAAAVGTLISLTDLKSFIASKEAEAGSLMDFALARIDELSLQKTIFDIEELLPDIGIFPLLLGDTTRLAQCFSIIREQYISKEYSAELTYKGLAITFRKLNGKTKERSNDTEKAQRYSLILAEKIILMHGGDFFLDREHCIITLPWTTLTGQELSGNPVSSNDHVLVLSESFMPDNFFSLPCIRDIEEAQPGKTAFIVWNAEGASPEDMVKAASLRRRSEFASVPFLCYGFPQDSYSTIDSAISFIGMIESALKSPKRGTVLFIGFNDYWDESLETFLSKKDNMLEKIRINSIAAFDETIGEIKPLLIVFDSLDVEGASIVRQHPITVMVPILMISRSIDNLSDVTALSQYSRLLICHRAVIPSLEFQMRIQALIAGDEILPPHTGILVKKAIHYFDQHAESHIYRWKLADSVHVSEDYLTRIFHKEMGLSLWDYLNRLRVFLAAKLLRQTDDTIRDIALSTGFQDHAYFSRVFKKIYGVSPGQIRKQQ